MLFQVNTKHEKKCTQKTASSINSSGWFKVKISLILSYLFYLSISLLCESEKGLLVKAIPIYSAHTGNI